MLAYSKKRIKKRDLTRTHTYKLFYSLYLNTLDGNKKPLSETEINNEICSVRIHDQIIYCVHPNNQNKKGLNKRPSSYVQ